MLDDTAEPADGERWKGRFRLGLSIVAGGAALAYLAHQLWSSWAEVRAIPWSSATLFFVSLVVLLQIASTLFDGWAWGWLLRRLGVSARPRVAVSVFAIAQFGKYLPGNVAQHVGRVALAKKAGWPLPRVVVTMLLESGFAVGTCALVVSVALLRRLEGAGGARSTPLLALLVLGFVAGVLVAKRLLERPPRFVQKRLGLGEPVSLSAATLAAYLAVNLLGLVALGASFAFSLRSVSPVALEPFWFVPAVAMASWLFGYLVPGAPAGLGVREAGLVALLGPLLGPGIVATAALIWRIAALVGDCAVLLIGLALADRTANGEPMP